MKTKIMFLLLAMVVAFASCKKTTKLPDPVLDLPVQHQWEQSEISVIDSISASTSVAEARAMIGRSGLTENILKYLGIKNAKVEYYIIKAGKDTLKVTDTLGNTFNGILSKDQLLAKITTPDGKSRSFFVRCMNGMVSPVNGEYVGSEIYTLAEGEGPMHYGATYEQVWDMAVRYNLILTAYRKKHKVRDAKSLQDFQSLAAQYGIVRINSLQPGDRLKKNFDGSWDYLE